MGVRVFARRSESGEPAAQRMARIKARTSAGSTGASRSPPGLKPLPMIAPPANGQSAAALLTFRPLPMSTGIGRFLLTSFRSAASGATPVAVPVRIAASAPLTAMSCAFSSE